MLKKSEDNVIKEAVVYFSYPQLVEPGFEGLPW